MSKDACIVRIDRDLVEATLKALQVDLCDYLNNAPSLVDRGELVRAAATLTEVCSAPQPVFNPDQAARAWSVALRCIVVMMISTVAGSGSLNPRDVN